MYETSEFRKGLKGVEDEVQKAIEEPPARVETPPYSAAPTPPPVPHQDSK